jgi:hypothetical protein
MRLCARFGSLLGLFGLGVALAAGCGGELDYPCDRNAPKDCRGACAYVYSNDFSTPFTTFECLPRCSAEATCPEGKAPEMRGEEDPPPSNTHVDIMQSACVCTRTP